jgi:cobalt/nickel transport system permease protein
VRHQFIDKYAYLNSPIHGVDPRAKVISAFAAIVIVVSENYDGEIIHFLWYFILLTGIAILSGVPVIFLMKRVLVVVPFIAMASIFYPVSAILEGKTVVFNLQDSTVKAALIIFSKSFTSVTILVLLTSTERFHRLLMALRKLRMPKLICGISAMLYRYIFLLTEEAQRTTLARESRTPGKLKVNKINVYGNQAAVIFLRSWERSQTIYSSMLSRGFKGEFPDMHQLNLRLSDVLFATMFIFIFLLIRIWN